jgi:transposase InsO family protein
MMGLYAVAGVSRQGHFQWLGRQGEAERRDEVLLEEARHLRREHPRLGARKMYKVLGPPVGRDKFEALLLDNGLRLTRQRNYARTTRPHPSIRYPNLIEGMKVKRLDQLWVSDITYVPFEGRFYYLTLITDVYSRRIVGWAASRTLAAEANLRALKQAIKLRGGAIPAGLIHHSDRGSQYVDEEYVALLKKHKARISMGDKAWKNAHAERINGTIKNEYILPLGFKSYDHLVRLVRTTVRRYNTIRPHRSLPGELTPCGLEEAIATGTLEMTYEVKINY